MDQAVVVVVDNDDVAVIVDDDDVDDRSLPTHVNSSGPRQECP